MLNRRMLVTLILLAIAAASPVSAQYEGSRHTVDGGGAMSSTGGTYSLDGTIGQPDAGPWPMPMSGGGYELAGGFWSNDAECGSPGDLNADGDVNGQDVQAFTACLLQGASGCDCGDQTGDGLVTLADIQPFVALLTSP